MSQRGHHKTTGELGSQKRHVKARNLMSAASPECVVVRNVSGTTYLPVCLLSVNEPPSGMSSRGHHKVTCELGARKRHVKARNLMSAVSPECVVDTNTPDTTYLTSATSNGSSSITIHDEIFV
jgi:hypothetical protein